METVSKILLLPFQSAWPFKCALPPALSSHVESSLAWGAFPAREVLLSLKTADSRDRVGKHASTDTSVCLTLCDAVPLPHLESRAL